MGTTGREQTRRAVAAGTTLVELLVVLFIVSLLLGIGVGVFGKFSVLSAADNAGAGIRSMVRVIRDHARNHGTVGTVVLDAENNRVLGLLERVVGQWHFESAGGATTGAFDHDPRLLGGAELVRDGCIGGALRLDGGPGAGAELGRAVTFESEWGIALSADVWLEEAQGGGGTLLAKGDAYGLRLEGTRSLVGWVGVTEEGEIARRLDVVEASSGEEKVPCGRWARIGLYYDRVQLRLFIDARQVAEAQEGRPLGQAPDKPLVLGGGTSAIKGKVDGVRLSVLGPAEGGELPPGVKLGGGTRVIRFDAQGRLDARYHRVPAKIVLEGADGGLRTVAVGPLGDVSLE